MFPIKIHLLVVILHGSASRDEPGLYCNDFLHSSEGNKFHFDVRYECLDVNLRCVSHRDICPILKDPAALTAVIDLFEDHVRKNHLQVDLIVGKTTTC